MSARPGLSALALSVTLIASAATAAPVPLEDFFRHPAFYDVQISRDGRYLSAITRTDKLPTARNIVVMEIGRWDEARLVTAYEDEEVRWHSWLDGGQLVFKVDRAYEDPGKTSEYVGFYTVRHDGKKGRALHEPFRRDSRRGRGTSASNMASSTGGIRETLRMIDDLPNRPDQVLVEMSEGLTGFQDAARLDLRSGALDVAGDARGSVTDWFADNQGRVRAAIDRGEDRDDLVDHLVYRETEADEWRTVMDLRIYEYEAHGFDKDDRHFWLSSRTDRDQAGLFRVDLETGELGDPIVADPVYDVMNFGGGMRGLLRDRDGTALGFEYMTERPRFVALDDQWAEYRRAIDGVLPDTYNQIVAWSDDHQRLVVRTRSDRDPGGYFLLDLEAGRLRHVVSRRAWIDPGTMSEMNPVSFEARDGLTIHGYLTLPAAPPAPACETPCPPPLIVHPHGGPYDVRDNWGFNDDVQFLTSRGYAVLQVNYRGSGGYGREFLNAGFRRWGLEMQDDLTDAARWAVQQGYADPSRIGIYGASYGGYATLMGLVKTPGLYRVGISYVGVADLLALHRQGTRRDRRSIGGVPEWYASWWRAHMGDPGSDRDRLRETSPLNGVERIEAPLLVIHGQADPRVEYDYQYQPLIRALKRHDKVHETLVKRHEGHGFYREQNQVELYGRIERFLRTHMPAGPESGTRAPASP